MKPAFRYTREPTGRYASAHAQLAHITSTICREVDGWHWAICDEARGGMRADGRTETLAAAKDTANAIAPQVCG